MIPTRDWNEFKIILAGLILVSLIGVSANAEDIQITVRPDFPDPRLLPIPELDYENGMLFVTKLDPNSRLDLIFNGEEIIRDSLEDSFIMPKRGCYWVEEENQYSAIDSNKVCRNIDGSVTIFGHPHTDYVEKRTFLKSGDITLILLPTQQDLRFLSACPQTYSERLLACYRNEDGDKFIISSWETLSFDILQHELKHAECNCGFHD